MVKSLLYRLNKVSITYRSQIIVFLVCVSAFFYLFSYSQYGINLWDEGVLLNGTERLLGGELPVRDFQGYMPGRYLLLAAF